MEENRELTTTQNTGLTTTQSTSNGKRISTGAFAGICAGCGTVGLAIGTAVGWFVRKWHETKGKKEEKKKEPEKNEKTAEEKK